MADGGPLAPAAPAAPPAQTAPLGLQPLIVMSPTPPVQLIEPPVQPIPTQPIQQDHIPQLN